MTQQGPVLMTDPNYDIIPQAVIINVITMTTLLSCDLQMSDGKEIYLVP